jgi:uncharacterized protein YbjT (DUF2867 family)
METVSGKTALVVGATGLIGSILTRLLLQSDRYGQVRLLVRRKMDLSHPKLVQEIVDFDRLEPERVRGDDVFCCLGTTIKVAGSKEAFYKVDCTYPYEVARLAKANGASQYLLITAMGADTRSWFFYNRVKGDVEQKIDSLSYDSFSIFRPSLLLGDRQEERPGEKAAQNMSGVLSALMVGPLKKYKPVEARKVANAMLAVAAQERKGKQILESDELQRY